MRCDSTPNARALDSDLLARIVERVVRAVRPQRVILFGSAARGEMGVDSDVDLLLVMPPGAHRRDAARAAYLALSGLGIAKDVIAATEEDLLRLGDNPSLVYRSALREGKEVYRASP